MGWVCHTVRTLIRRSQARSIPISSMLSLYAYISFLVYFKLRTFFCKTNSCTGLLLELLVCHPWPWELSHHYCARSYVLPVFLALLSVKEWLNGERFENYCGKFYPSNFSWSRNSIHAEWMHICALVIVYVAFMSHLKLGFDCQHGWGYPLHYLLDCKVRKPSNFHTFYKQSLVHFSLRFWIRTNHTMNQIYSWLKSCARGEIKENVAVGIFELMTTYAYCNVKTFSTLTPLRIEVGFVAVFGSSECLSCRQTTA